MVWACLFWPFLLSMSVPELFSLHCQSKLLSAPSLDFCKPLLKSVPFRTWPMSVYLHSQHKLCIILPVPGLVLQHPASQKQIVLFSVCHFILGWLCGWIHWLLWSCPFSLSHHSKCFSCVSNIWATLLSSFFSCPLAAFPSCPTTVPTAWVVLPCQLPMPRQTPWAPWPLSSVQWSSSWQL